ncbi:Fe2+-dependent dioxygenase [[Acidovorax] ebreus]|uniref:PKHD-type hydroxylase Dtpsy_0528 n=1 Tax=Acidovorax ebreus (strain TPSY) TaxID=535289 RepID=Y528_ACIET|nr:Fe2+-dependent dioxygenase [[Acidovorax] ebreus]B9MCK8.1 RecName: Full=PKHD-type hydroxylase Dtpsy_0528 [[Acidovorax] ebreus TPSY]ACM32008.1 2OG-Fe(II) oxygenase [[Acidovorax] ebreus TPSY]
MLISIDQVLSKTEVRDLRAQLDAAAWEDGAATAGTLAKSVKRNQQINDGSELCQRLGQHILRRLSSTPLFISAALPRTIYPPKFNRYADGGTYGAHVDSALMFLPGSHQQMRTDLSATLFLAEPEEYDGGELEVEGPFGVQAVKLAAGDMVLYPSSSLHRVTPVTRGARVASFFWIESLVQDEGERTLLFDLDQSIQQLTPLVAPDDPRLVQLTGVYHNLLRRWARP